MTAGAGHVSAQPGGWRRLVRRAEPRTVRARVTVVAGLALTAAVVLGLVVMYRLQLNSADRTIQDQLRTYATQIEQSAAGGTFPRTLPPSVLNTTAQAQVLAPDGTVLSATRNLAGQPALYTLAPGTATPVRQPAADRVLPSDLSVYGERVTVGGRPVIIIATTATYLRSQVNQTFARLLVIGVPFLLVLAGGTVWLVVGRALRPVEQIRGAVTAITSADLSQRVPEPGTDDEIGRLARTMNDMLARLEDSAARQRRFVADASHELRSPLTAIRTGLEVGLSHPDRAPWPEIARRAVRQSQRLEQLIAELLVLAKADARQLAARRQPVDLAALLAGLARHPGARYQHRPLGSARDGHGREPGGPVADVPQPAGQRGPVRPPPGGDHRRRRAGRCRGRGHRRRPRHPGRGAGAGVRPVRPAGRQPRAGQRVGGPRASHRPGDRGRARRHHRAHRGPWWRNPRRRDPGRHGGRGRRNHGRSV